MATAAPTVAAPPDAPPFAAGRWGDYRSERFGMRLPLPDGRAWRIDDHSGPWLSATHAGSGSALLVRAWREDGRADRRLCEEKARLWRALPEPGRAETVERHPVRAPRKGAVASAPPGPDATDFDTLVEVGVVPGKGGAPVSAFAIAFGGAQHRCFAYVFTTSAAGPGAEQIVGERLAIMVERSLGGVVLESGLLPRVPREPLP